MAEGATDGDELLQVVHSSSPRCSLGVVCPCAVLDSHATLPSGMLEHRPAVSGACRSPFRSSPPDTTVTNPSTVGHAVFWDID